MLRAEKLGSRRPYPDALRRGRRDGEALFRPDALHCGRKVGRRMGQIQAGQWRMGLIGAQLPDLSQVLLTL